MAKEEMREALQWKLKMLGHDPSYLDDVECRSIAFNTAFSWGSTPPGPSFWSGIDRTWNEVKFDPKVLQRELKRYCHVVGCKDIEACPETHLVCHIHLGLNTAVAWIAATAVDNAERVNTCLAIAELHDRKYPLLYVMLEKLMQSMGGSTDEL